MPTLRWPKDVSWREYRVGRLPFMLLKCPVCAALIQSCDAGKHESWHTGNVSVSWPDVAGEVMAPFYEADAKEASA